MKLRNILQKTSILIDLKATDKNDLLTQMATYLATLYEIKDPPFIVNKVLEREAEMSTGIGYGIAIPHARIDSIDHVYIIAGRVLAGIEYNAIDEQPVYIIFLMLSPANTSNEHTQMLSTLSRIMSYEDIRKGLLESPDAETFLTLLINAEDKYVE